MVLLDGWRFPICRGLVLRKLQGNKHYSIRLWLKQMKRKQEQKHAAHEAALRYEEEARARRKKVVEPSDDAKENFKERATDKVVDISDPNPPDDPPVGKFLAKIHARLRDKAELVKLHLKH